LKQPADDASAGSCRRVAVSDATALRLESALLAGDKSARREAVSHALAEDDGFAGWAMRVAECRLSRTVNHLHEAADWLAGSLVAELATSLQMEPTSDATSGIEGRLPALVSRFDEYEHALADFDKRLEREKLESLKELAYGASHEINNPLANIAARAQTLLDDEEDPERIRKLSAIHRQAMRAHEMISDLMLFARPPKLLAKTFDLTQLCARIVDELRDLAAERNVELSCLSEERKIEVSADETQIGVAIQAVVKNAVEAVGHGGHVRMTVRPFDRAGQSYAQVAVCDDGPGISDDARRHIFDPFFSGREAGRGLGFGLSKCWRIVTDHGGEVVVHRPSSGGAEFIVVLPMKIEHSQ
jgi:signal transduction histidine kinase